MADAPFYKSREKKTHPGVFQLNNSIEGKGRKVWGEPANKSQQGRRKKKGVKQSLRILLQKRERRGVSSRVKGGRRGKTRRGKVL